MKLTITETFIGAGPTYRKAYHVFRGGKFVCQYSSLDSAKSAYPTAEIELIEP